MNEKYILMEYKMWGFNAEFVKIINDFIIRRILSNRSNFSKYTTKYILGCYARVSICNHDIQRFCFALVIEIKQ